jgi:hypothetical protein
VHELSADGGTVVAARLFGVGTILRGCGKWLGRKELAEGIERGLEVSPAAEDIEGLGSGMRALGARRGVFVRFCASVVWGWVSVAMISFMLDL